MSVRLSPLCNEEVVFPSAWLVRVGLSSALPPTSFDEGSVFRVMYGDQAEAIIS